MNGLVELKKKKKKAMVHVQYLGYNIILLSKAFHTARSQWSLTYGSRLKNILSPHMLACQLPSSNLHKILEIANEIQKWQWTLLPPLGMVEN